MDATETLLGLGILSVFTCPTMPLVYIPLITIALTANMISAFKD